MDANPSSPLELQLVDMEEPAAEKAAAGAAFPVQSPATAKGTGSAGSTSASASPAAAMVTPTAGLPTNAKLHRELPTATSDEFLAEAAREYQEGLVDQALWNRSAARADNDEALALAGYLKARATALQLKRREERAATGVVARPARPTGDMQSRNADAPSDRAVERRARMPDPRHLAIGGIALVALIGAGWFFLSPGDPDPAPVQARKPAPAAAKTMPAAPQVVQPAGPDPALIARMQELRRAGNWNVFVLYASERTRKEPDNAAAWNELGEGYLNLRQFDDALDAANNAVRLAPGKPDFVRTLAHVQLGLDRLDEAGATFGRMLAVNGDDADALCGAALVAQRQSRPKDAAALAARVKNDGTCAGVNDAASATIAAQPAPGRAPPSRTIRR
jgi:cytochrome c-type biogenesis protein CcmH/NrfG